VIDSSKNFVSKLVVFVVSKVVYMLHLSICPSSLDHQEFQGLLSIHSVLCCHFPFFFIYFFFLMGAGITGRD
jgi:hypothetical protein